MIGGVKLVDNMGGIYTLTPHEQKQREMLREFEQAVIEAAASMTDDQRKMLNSRRIAYRGPVVIPVIIQRPSEYEISHLHKSASTLVDIILEDENQRGDAKFQTALSMLQDALVPVGDAIEANRRNRIEAGIETDVP